MQAVKVVLSAVDNTKQALESASGGLEKLKGSAATAAAALSAIGVAAPLSLGAAASAVLAAANSTAQHAQQLTNLSNIANTSIEQFSAMSWAAERHGVSAEKLADIYKDVQDKVGDFIQTGGGAMKDFFENIAPHVGVTADQFRRLSGPEALQLYYSSLEKANLSQADLVFYMEAIASDATALIPLLKNGGSEFRRLSDEARSLGVVMDDISAKKAKDFADKMAKLESVSRGLQIEIGNAVIPALNRLAEEFLDARSAGLGFGEMLNTIWRTTPLNSGEQIKSLTSEIDALQQKLSKPQTARARGMMQEELDALLRQREYFKSRLKSEDRATASEGVDDSFGMLPPVDPPKLRPATKPTQKSTDRKENPEFARMDYLGDLHKTAAQELENHRKEADQLTKANAAMAQSVDGLTKAYAQRNQTAAEALLSQEERALAESLRAVADRAQQAREALSQKAAMMQDSTAAQAEYQRQLSAVNAAEEAQIAIEKANHSSRLAMQADWTVGAGRALQNYRSQAIDVAGATEQAFSRAFGGMEDALVSFVQTGKLDFSNLANSIISDMIRIQIRASMTQALGGASGAGWLAGLFGKLFGIGGSGMDTSFTSGLGSATNLPSYSAMSFDGGGYTGPGSRSGGLDGKGGFWAMLHPQETVIDHTKGQSSSPTINISIKNEAANTQAEVASTRTNGDGGIDVEMIVRQVMARDQSINGPITRGFGSRFGLRGAV